MAWPAIDWLYTLDGMHLRTARVRRVMNLTYETSRLASYAVADIAHLDCDIARDGRHISVCGARETLDEIERLLTS
jgi:hypothetical protein